MSLPDKLNEWGKGKLPGLIGLEVLQAGEGRIRSRLPLRDELLAPNGYLHAATVVALADTSCGYGCFVSLPDGAQGFTTVDLKSNFLGTKREGAVACDAALVHGGRATQV
nr:PaaI family thioesterase [Actinomycetota bacterium]